MVILILIFLFNTTLISNQGISLIDLITFAHNNYKRLLDLTMGVLLKLLLSNYIVRKTRDFSITANVVMSNKKCHVNLFNDCTASIYFNAQCKHKHIRPFSHVYVHKLIRLSSFSFGD